MSRRGGSSSSVRSVQVLLSTYNGTPYLAALLDSVLSQRGVAVDVLARDDGSTDGTPALLQAYAHRGRVRVVAGSNVGVARSFLWLLAHASREADAVALADQDDVWLPGKLARAVGCLEACPSGEAALYCSRLRLVDVALRPLALSSRPPRGPSFENALYENVVTGCTAVLNRAGVELVASELPGAVHMHDWWLYQVAASRGRVLCSDRPPTLSRQPGAKVGGAKIWAGARGWARARRILDRRRALFGPAQLRELYRIHGPALTPERRRLLEQLIAPQPLRSRLRLAVSRHVVCQSRWKEGAVRGLLALGLA